MAAAQHATGLGWLLDAGDGAVVTLVAGDTRLLAHRAVLVDRSPVFEAMFRHDTLEASSGEIAIPDVEGPVLRQLLEYLYTLQVPQQPGIAPQLLVAADKYGVLVLKQACEQQVAAQLSVETAAAAAVLAIRHSCCSLRQAAIDLIRRHPDEVKATQGWADAVRMQPEDVEEINRLLADTRSLPPEEKTRRLMEAAKQGAVGELQALLAAGADVAAREEDKGMWTALHWAAREGHEEAARLLLAAGAAVNRRDSEQQTPLHWAAGRGHEEAARRLLAAGAAVDARDRWQETPLHWAAGGGHAAVVRLLLENGADHGARDDFESTPLHLAAYEGHIEAAAALLEAGADRAATDRWGNTPLDEARRNNHQQVAQLLEGS